MYKHCLKSANRFEVNCSTSCVEWVSWQGRDHSVTKNEHWICCYVIDDFICFWCLLVDPNLPTLLFKFEVPYRRKTCSKINRWNGQMDRIRQVHFTRGAYLYVNKSSGGELFPYEGACTNKALDISSFPAHHLVLYTGFHQLVRPKWKRRMKDVRWQKDGEKETRNGEHTPSIHPSSSKQAKLHSGSIRNHLLDWFKWMSQDTKLRDHRHKMHC